MTEPDEFDVHPDMLGDPVEVDYDTGAVRVLEGEEAERALAYERSGIPGMLLEMAEQNAEAGTPPAEEA